MVRFRMAITKLRLFTSVSIAAITILTNSRPTYGIEDIADEFEDYVMLSWPEPSANALFGTTIVMNGGEIAIGAPTQVFWNSVTNSLFPFGAVFTMFERLTWNNGQILTDDTWKYTDCTSITSWYLGESVAMTSSNLALGAPKKEIETSQMCYNKAGQVYIYDKLLNWAPQFELLSPTIESGELFGDAVAVTAQQVLVGASSIEVYNDHPGKVYIYDFAGPTLVDTLSSGQDPNRIDGFGAAIAIDELTETLMVIGSPRANDPASPSDCGGFDEGGAYIYRLVTGIWTFEEVLWPSDFNVRGEFGKSVACNIDASGTERIVVGEPNRCINSTGCQTCTMSSEGKVSVYKHNLLTGLWELEAELESPAVSPQADDFGHSVDLDGWDIVIGAPGEGPFGVPSPGAAYLVSFTPCGGWQFRTRFIANTLDPLESTPSRRLGSSVALENGKLVIGASQTDLDGDFQGEVNYGAAYAYQYTPTVVEHCSGDFDGNGQVNTTDLLVIVANWNPIPSSVPILGDMNCDMAVDVSDLLDLINVWGFCSGSGVQMPSAVQDCLSLYPSGSIELQDCLGAIQ